MSHGSFNHRTSAFARGNRRVWRRRRENLSAAAAQLEAEHWGKYITIHPLTGDYELGRTLRSSDKKLRKKYPNVAFVINRIGYRAVGHFGGTGALDGKGLERGSQDQWREDYASVSLE